MSILFSPARKKELCAMLLKCAPGIIVVITALLYSKAVFSEFTNFDDAAFILHNPLVQDSSLDGISKIFTTFSAGKYQPLTNLSFALEYRFFGFDPLPFHLTNVVLHLFSAFIVFKVAERLSGSRITAIVVSLFFGIHPMHTEAVAWAAERKDLLYAFFYLLSMLAYLRYMESGYRLKYYIAVFLLFLFSLFSKTEAITLPLVLLLIDVYKGRRIALKAVLEKLPLLAFSLFFGILGFLSQQTDGVIGHHTVAHYSFTDHVFLFTAVPAFYIIKLIAPFHLSAMHLYPDLHDGLLPWVYYASLPFMVFLLWLVVRRSPFRKEMIFGASFFLITICIMPQIVFIGPSLTPERYSYIPYIGLFYIAGQWIAGNGIAKWPMPVLTLVTGFAIMCSVQTWERIDAWKNDNVIFTDIIEKNADVADCAYFNLLRANSSLDKNDFYPAIEDYNEVISKHPDYVDAYAKRGHAHFMVRDIPAAIADFDSAIRLNPKYAMYYYNRASLKANSGNVNDALQDYTSCLKLDSYNSAAYEDRGVIRLTLKDSAGACEDWKNAAMLGNTKAQQLVQQICRQR